MVKFIELKTKDAREFATYVKDNELPCTLHISKATRGKAYLRVETDEGTWKQLKIKLRRKQLLFDYYDENNENIAPPFKKLD